MSEVDIKKIRKIIAAQLKVKQLVIHHGYFGEAIERVVECVEGGGSSGVPKGVIVLGESGAGKSKLFEYVHAMYPDGRNEENALKPILRARIPQRPTVPQLVTVLLDKIGDKHYGNKDSETVKTIRLVRLIKACGVKAIMLEELQHFVERAGYKTQGAVTDWLKLMVEDAGVSIVISGQPEAGQVITNNRQLGRRFGSPVTLPGYKWENDAMRDEFCNIVYTIQESIDCVKIPDLARGELAFHVYVASSGLLGRLANFMMEVVSIGLKKKSRSISVADLAKAARVANYEILIPGIVPFKDVGNLNKLES